MIDENKDNEIYEFEADHDIVHKINDYIFLDSRRYDGYAGDDI